MAREPRSSRDSFLVSPLEEDGGQEGDPGLQEEKEIELDVVEETSEKTARSDCALWPLSTIPGGSGSPQRNPPFIPIFVPGMRVRTCTRQTPKEERGRGNKKGAGYNFRLRLLWV